MSNKPSLLKLVEGKYEEWAIIMEATLIAAELWSVVEPKELELVAKGVKAVQTKKTKQQQAWAKIVLSLEVSQIPFVTGLVDPHEIWTTLRDIHRSQLVNSVLSLRRHFFCMRKLESESTLNFIGRVRKAAYELSNTPAPVFKLDQILIITNGLPEEYSTVVTALDNLPFKELKMANVIMCITGHEAQIQHMEEKNTDSAVALIVRGGKGQPRKLIDRSMIYYNCQGFGHIVAICPSMNTRAHIATVEDMAEELSAHIARTGLDDSDVIQLF